MNCEKMPYETPEVSFWSAEELDAIEATMSGYGGGGYVPPEPSDPSNSAKSPHVVGVNWEWESVTTKNQYWFSINDSGVHTLEISVGASSRLLIYSKSPVNGKTKQVDGDMSSGSKSVKIETDYRSTTLVCVKPSKRTAIKCRAKRFVYNIPKSKIGDCGVEWKPAKALFRPDESELCLSRWYIAKDYIPSAMMIFSDDAFSTVSEASSSGFQKAMSTYIKKNIAKLAAKSDPIAEVVSGLIGKVSIETFKQIRNGIYKCATGGKDGLTLNGVLLCVDQHIDLSGGSSVQTPQYGFVPWDGGSAFGESGYDTGMIRTI